MPFCQVRRLTTQKIGPSSSSRPKCSMTSLAVGVALFQRRGAVGLRDHRVGLRIPDIVVDAVDDAVQAGQRGWR